MDDNDNCFIRKPCCCLLQYIILPSLIEFKLIECFVATRITDHIHSEREDTLVEYDND